MKYTTILLCIFCAFIVYYDVRTGAQLYSQIQTLINSFINKVDFLKSFVDGIYNSVDSLKLVASFIWESLSDSLTGWFTDIWGLITSWF